MKPLAVEVRGLTKTYPGDVQAVRGIDFDVFPGEVFGLLGPNGAGKSTTVGMLTGTVAPTAGNARLAGWDVVAEPLAARRASAVVFQESVVDRPLTGRRNLEIHARLWGVEPAKAGARLHEVVDAFGLGEIIDRPVASYSGGQRRRLELARALLSDPQVLFLDEPTVGLDVQARETMWSTIRRLIAQGCSIVLTTHYLEEAEALADRVAVLARGELIALGTVDEVRSIVSRKKITCSSALPIGAVRAWPGVVDATGDEHRMQITTADAEAVVRRLLASDQNLRNLEIKQAGLAEAFAELTKEAA
jgi:ABC-2 type transport system ATP-binding protein